MTSSKEKKMELGVLKINNDVLASIAKNAAMEVNGVMGTKNNPFSIFSSLINAGYNNRGIKLNVVNNEVKITLDIIVQYGLDIPGTASSVQESVKTAIEEMTGLTVCEVNINISDIYSEKTGK